MVAEYIAIEGARSQFLVHKKQHYENAGSYI